MRIGNPHFPFRLAQTKPKTKRYLCRLTLDRVTRMHMPCAALGPAPSTSDTSLQPNAYALSYTLELLYMVMQVLIAKCGGHLSTQKGKKFERTAN